MPLDRCTTADRMKSNLECVARVRGCLLGGAVGDALGAPVEFLSTAEIRAHFGNLGIQDFAPAFGRVGAITDDTQMTLFTAEGLIRAHARYQTRGIREFVSVIHHALLRWLYTQGQHSPLLRELPDGWLAGRSGLFNQRAPGLTCLAALEAARRLGEDAQNNSKGCGAIMRVAPIGLFVAAFEEHGETNDPWSRVYELACASARTTHGHVSSTAASGFFALVIARLAEGQTLRDAVRSARGPLETHAGAGEVKAAVTQALELADSDARPMPESVERLGQGWVAEEALAIALFCALRAETFEGGVRMAVNHGGDSDSTGSLTGQLLGTLWGERAIPRRWLDRLELRNVIEAVADDMSAILQGRALSGERDYPPW